MFSIVVAPDKFKGTLSAEDATSIISECARKAFPEAEIRHCPMADGGEGTAALIGRLKGYSRQTIKVADALMWPIESEYYLSPNKREAIIDSSAVVGLQLISPESRNPWISSSYPLGKVVLELLSSGIEHISIGIGGTATVDCGIGFLQGLGAIITGVDGAFTSPVRACDLHSIIAIDISPIAGFANKISGISDVDVPLLDTDGYPSMLSFAPQKGVGEDSLIVLQMAMEQIIERTHWKPSQPDFECRFGGAGGGLGFALKGVLGCDVQPGAQSLIDAYGIFNAPLPSLVLTGEGSFDEQSLTGKAAGTIREMCLKKNIPCYVLAGTADASTASLPGIIATDCFPPFGIELSPEVAELRLKEATEKTLKEFL